MPITEKIINVFDTFLPLLLTLIIVVFILWLAHIVLIKRQNDLGNEKLFSRQLSMLGLTIADLLTVILALPVSESSRNQIEIMSPSYMNQRPMADGSQVIPATQKV